MEPATNLEPAPVLPAAPPEQPAAYFTLREAAVFGSIVGAILLSANAVVCATWSYFFSLPGWLVWQAGPGAIALAFVPATILRFRSSHPALRIVYAVSATWLGALNFAFFAAVGCWIAAGVAWLAGWHLPHFFTAAILFGLAGAATMYGLINRRWIRVNRITVRLSHLPPAWSGRTAALLTDLHLGPLFGADFLCRVIDRLRLLRPDVVFISGDMFDGSPLGLDHLVAPWREFSAPRGIYYVTGNHDEFVERTLFTEAVQRTGIRVLNNEKIAVDGLQIIGVHDAEAGHPATLREILLHGQIDRSQPAILLAHRPIHLAIAEEAGISLQLSGHTHGGQVWPWNLLVARIYGRFAAGLGRRGALQVYTSNGVGTWGPPLRVGTKSEIVLIQFEEA
jgi:predicted MPP superfamily phosphohydrolase